MNPKTWFSAHCIALFLNAGNSPNNPRKRIPFRPSNVLLNSERRNFRVEDRNSNFYSWKALYLTSHHVQQRCYLFSQYHCWKIAEKSNLDINRSLQSSLYRNRTLKIRMSFLLIAFSCAQRNNISGRKALVQKSLRMIIMLSMTKLCNANFLALFSWESHKI